MVHLLPILLVPAAALTVYKVTAIYTRLNIAYPIALTRSVPASLSNHRTIKSIINPDSLPALSDTHEVVIPWPQTSKGGSVPEEQILARLCCGFFGGMVMTPERTVLGLARKNLLGIFKLDALPVPQNIWRRDDLSPDNMLEVGSKLFGTFQVADRHVARASASDVPSQSSSGEESFITFAFGYDEGLFKGVHRFYVSRVRSPGSSDEFGKDTRWLRLRMSSTNILTSDSPYMQKAMDWLGGFHLMYAGLLFRDAVAEVLRPGR